MKSLVMRTILFVLPRMLEFTARRHPVFRERLKQHDVTAWFGLMDESIGATIAIRGGKVFAQAGSRAEADVALVFQDVYTALVFLMPGPDQGEIIHAAKNFKVVTVGRDDLLLWFTQTLNMSQTVGTEMGVKMRDGSRRYTTCTNGGPIFVYVKDGKILRTTPIDFDDKDAAELGDRGARQTFPAQAGRIGRAARLVPEIAGLFRQANSLSDEAGRFRSRRRTQSTKPRQVRLRADQLG